jgi:HEAT repeat protein
MRSLLFAVVSGAALGLVLPLGVNADDHSKPGSASAPPAALVDQVFKLAKPKDEMGFSPGIGQEAQNLSATYASHDHRKVVEALLPLLQDKRDGVADLASYIIRECDDGVAPEHLEALKKGYHNGGGWLPHAIAKLQSDEAAAFLAEEFRKNPQIQGQVDWALISLGGKAVPFLLKGFEEADLEKESAYIEGLLHIFGEMKGKGGTAVPRLLAVAESAKHEAERRKHAVLLIGAIGDTAEDSFPRLLVLSKNQPQLFADIVEQSIANSETAAAAPFLANYVESGNINAIYHIARLGAKGRAVGPRITRWLNHEDWEARAAAADALGAIGFREERQTLEKLLSSKTNWKVAYAAAKSLAALGSKASIPALSGAARGHWFPFVRKKAAESVSILEGKKPEDGADPFIAASYHAAEGGAWTIAPEKIPGLDLAPQRREEEFSAFERREPDLAKKFLSLRDWSGEGRLKHFGSMVLFQTKDGVLLGAQAGEWVGGMAYLPNHGKGTMLLRKDVGGIEQWRDRILVATGTYHLGMNDGLVSEVRLAGNKTEVVPWFVLPGSPKSMWISSKDQLVIECYGGTMVFSDPSTFEYHSAPRQKDN